MQIIISVKVLAALADIADKANGSEYSDKIAFMPGFGDAVATNGHVLAIANGANIEIQGSTVVTLSAKRVKGTISEAKGMESVKTLGTVILFDNDEEFWDYLTKQHRTPDRFPHAAFQFVPGYDYIARDKIENILNAKEREADTYIPSYNLKYQEKNI